MASFDFYDTNLHALRNPDAVLRDSIEALAVRILENRMDLSSLKPSDYENALIELREIIKNLHEAYSRVLGL